MSSEGDHESGDALRDCLEVNKSVWRSRHTTPIHASGCP